MKKDFFCGLDIGTAKVCATCGRLTPSGEIDILATHSVPTEGLESGRLVDIKRVSACINDALKRLRQMSGIKVRRVWANIDNPDLRVRTCAKKISFERNTRIKKFHIDDLINSAVSSHYSLDRQVIHVGFKNFVLDNQTESSYPEGLIGREVKLDTVIVSTLIPTLKSFAKCIKEAGLILEEIVPSSCAQALALLRNAKQNMNKSRILVDIGAGLTKIALVKNKLVRDIVILPLAAQSITEDIAVKLKVSSDCAERLKIKYGRAFYGSNPPNQKIIVKDRLVNRIIFSSGLQEIITLKVDYLLQEIKKALSELKYEDEQVAEIIFTGGGSILEGFLEKAEKTLGRKVKMGNLVAVKDNRIQTQSALYSTSIGLMHLGFINKDNRGLYKRTNFVPFMRMLDRARLLYREYF